MNCSDYCSDLGMGPQRSKTELYLRKEVLEISQKFSVSETGRSKGLSRQPKAPTK